MEEDLASEDDVCEYKLSTFTRQRPSVGRMSGFRDPGVQCWTEICFVKVNDMVDCNTRVCSPPLDGTASSGDVHRSSED